MGTLGRRELLERVTEAQLTSVLRADSAPLAKRLPREDLKSLGLSLGEAQKRWPSQDMSDSLEAYLQDFERLANRHSTTAVIRAMDELRIRPGQAFFPRPDEIAEEIERAKAIESERARTARWEGSYLDKWKQGWIDSRMQDADTQGMTREEFISGGCKGRKQA